MAKIKLGALAQDVRGSVAGNTFARNRGGAYVRQKVAPIQPRTARQLAQRAILTEVSQAWRTLTDAQRQGWTNWADNHPIMDVFGDTLVLSGNGAYSRVNAVRLTAGLAKTATAPADETPVANAASAAAVGSTGVVTVTFAAAPATGKLFLVYTTSGKSPGVAFVNSAFRLADVITGNNTDTDFDITPTDKNALLSYSATQVVGVRVVAIGANGVVQSTTLFKPVAS